MGREFELEQKIDVFAQKICNEPVNYEQKYVAFIDIIGFRSIIDDKDAFWIKKNIYDDIRKVDTLFRADIFSESMPNSAFKELEFIILSDSVIISIPVVAEHALDVLLITCITLQEMFFTRSNPILLRGGITAGEFLHFDQITFGPALVKAYLLESEVAIYPRIVIDKKINISEENVKSRLLMKLMCEIDFDGCQFINYIIFSILKNRRETEICSSIKDYIQTNREAYKHDERKYAKYNWLTSKYNVAAWLFSSEENNALTEIELP